MGHERSATPDVAEASSRIVALSPTLTPEAFPWVDASCVARVISGEDTLETAVKRRGPPPPGTIPFLDDCRGIKVWGLTGDATEEELRSLCSKFCTVTDVDLLNSKANGDIGFATVTFGEASAAQLALSSLQRTSLYGKVCYKQVLGYLSTSVVCCMHSRYVPAFFCQSSGDSTPQFIVGLVGLLKGCLAFMLVEWGPAVKLVIL